MTLIRKLRYILKGLLILKLAKQNLNLYNIGQYDDILDLAIYRFFRRIGLKYNYLYYIQLNWHTWNINKKINEFGLSVIQKTPEFIIFKDKNGLKFKVINNELELKDFLYLYYSIFIRDEYGYFNLKDRIILDLGAHIGMFSLYSAVNGAKKVFAIEPHPIYFKILKENIEMNRLSDKIVALNYAISKTNGKILFYMAGVGSSIKYKVGKEIEVESVALDNLINLIKVKPDLIKMDIEGAEIDAIISGKKFLKLYKPKLIVAAYHNELDFIFIPKILRKLGYRKFILNVNKDNKETVLYAE